MENWAERVSILRAEGVCVRRMDVCVSVIMCLLHVHVCGL